MWGKCGERKQKNPRRTHSTRVLCTRSRSPVIVVYWGLNWPNCMKMRDFELVDTQYLQLIDLLAFMKNLQKMLVVVVWSGDQKWPTLNLCAQMSLLEKLEFTDVFRTRQSSSLMPFRSRWSGLTVVSPEGTQLSAPSCRLLPCFYLPRTTLAQARTGYSQGRIQAITSRKSDAQNPRCPDFAWTFLSGIHRNH